ncbi:uncharacterized protein LOC134191420 [Corticium candelabrum]|uniref:uncharacterized protein LOC134191420 n=1 Tax=Corticium candelabrum TaxID=121492 RepID=UPI002E272EC0|nr:uncharacterized protein LOC134191420 [Corticium candelabrum]
MVSLIVTPEFDPDEETSPCAPPPSPECFLRHDTVAAVCSESLATPLADRNSSLPCANDEKLIGLMLLQQKEEKMEVDPPAAGSPKRRSCVKRKKDCDSRDGRDVAQDWGKKLRSDGHHQATPVVPFYLSTDSWR